MEKNTYLILTLFYLYAFYIHSTSSFSYAESTMQDPHMVTGYILDQTKTRLGREFYETFAQKWEFIPGLENYTILISEITDARWGSQILIFVEDNLIYVSALKPRLEDIDLKVEEAIDALLQYFIYLQEKEKAIKEEKTFF